MRGAVEGRPIAALLAAGPTLSFEFFPPRTPEAVATLRETVADLAPLAPAFVSVTYGAGGTTRDLTHGLVVDLLADGWNPMAHLTAVQHTRDELADIVAGYRDAGVRNVLALRGDPPADVEPFRDLEHAADLVALVREVAGGGTSIGVAARALPLSSSFSTFPVAAVVVQVFALVLLHPRRRPFLLPRLYPFGHAASDGQQTLLCRWLVRALLLFRCPLCHPRCMELQ